MRAIGTPLACCVLLVFPCVVTSQGHRPEPPRAVLGGFSVLAPLTLYDGTITYHGLVHVSDEVTSGGSRRTQYSEDMHRRVEGWLGLRLPLRGEHMVLFRARAGETGSTASYEGGGVQRLKLDRGVSWFAADVLLGVAVWNSPSFRAFLHVGPSLTRYAIDTRNRGPDQIARLAAEYSGRVPDVVDWSNRAWVNLNLLIGGSVEFRIRSDLDLSVGIEQRILWTNGHAMEVADREDIADAIGRPLTLSYSPWMSYAPSLSVGVSWRPWEDWRIQEEPGFDPARLHREPRREPAPSLPEAAVRALATGDTAQAIGHLRGAVGEDPDNSTAWGRLGVLLLPRALAGPVDSEVWIEARKALERALELDPGNAGYLKAFGELMERSRRSRRPPS